MVWKQTSYLSFFLHKCTFWAQFFSTWKRVNCGKISQNFSKFPKISPHDIFFSTNIICDICDKYELCKWYVSFARDIGSYPLADAMGEYPNGSSRKILTLPKKANPTLSHSSKTGVHPDSVRELEISDPDDPSQVRNALLHWAFFVKLAITII